MSVAINPTTLASSSVLLDQEAKIPSCDKANLIKIVTHPPSLFETNAKPEHFPDGFPRLLTHVRAASSYSVTNSNQGIYYDNGDGNVYTGQCDTTSVQILHLNGLRVDAIRVTPTFGLNADKTVTFNGFSCDPTFTQYRPQMKDTSNLANITSYRPICMSHTYYCTGNALESSGTIASVSFQPSIPHSGPYSDLTGPLLHAVLDYLHSSYGSLATDIAMDSPNYCSPAEHDADPHHVKAWCKRHDLLYAPKFPFRVRDGSSTNAQFLDLGGLGADHETALVNYPSLKWNGPLVGDAALPTATTILQMGGSQRAFNMGDYTVDRICNRMQRWSSAAVPEGTPETVYSGPIKGRLFDCWILSRTSTNLYKVTPLFEARSVGYKLTTADLLVDTEWSEDFSMSVVRIDAGQDGFTRTSSDTTIYTCKSMYAASVVPDPNSLLMLAAESSCPADPPFMDDLLKHVSQLPRSMPASMNDGGMMAGILTKLAPVISSLTPHIKSAARSLVGSFLGDNPAPKASGQQPARAGRKDRPRRAAAAKTAKAENQIANQLAAVTKKLDKMETKIERTTKRASVTPPTKQAPKPQRQRFVKVTKA